MLRTGDLPIVQKEPLKLPRLAARPLVDADDVAGKHLRFGRVGDRSFAHAVTERPEMQAVLFDIGNGADARKRIADEHADLKFSRLLVFGGKYAQLHGLSVARKGEPHLLSAAPLQCRRKVFDAAEGDRIRRKNEIARLEPRFLRRTAGALLARDGAQLHDLNASRREGKPRRHASDIIFRRRGVRLQAAFRHARRAQERRRAHARQAAFPMRSLIKFQPAHKSSREDNSSYEITLRRPQTDYSVFSGCPFRAIGAGVF